MLNLFQIAARSRLVALKPYYLNLKKFLTINIRNFNDIDELNDKDASEIAIKNDVGAVGGADYFKSVVATTLAKKNVNSTGQVPIADLNEKLSSIQKEKAVDFARQFKKKNQKEKIRSKEIQIIKKMNSSEQNTKPIYDVFEKMFKSNEENDDTDKKTYSPLSTSIAKQYETRMNIQQGKLDKLQADVFEKMFKSNEENDDTDKKTYSPLSTSIAKQYETRMNIQQGKLDNEKKLVDPVDEKPKIVATKYKSLNKNRQEEVKIKDVYESLDVSSNHDSKKDHLVGDSKKISNLESYQQFQKFFNKETSKYPFAKRKETKSERIEKSKSYNKFKYQNVKKPQNLDQIKSTNEIKKDEFKPIKYVKEIEEDEDKITEKFDKQYEAVKTNYNLNQSAKFVANNSSNTQMVSFNENNKLKLTHFEKEVEDEENLSEMEQLERDIENLKPVARQPVYNLAYYVNRNPLLEKLVEMGVSIRKWDKDRAICQFILTLDMEKLKQHLIFLNDLGLNLEQQAHILTKNPYILKEPIDDLHARIDYLKSKRLTFESIRDITANGPFWLTRNLIDIDTRLGWLQKTFNLNGDQVRTVITNRPKLISLPIKTISDIYFCLKEIVCFTDEELKTLLITYPKLFTKDYKIIESNFIFLTQVMKVTHKDIVGYPPILQCPQVLIKSRYTYLKHLDRLQLDPTKPNFVSLKALIEPFDSTFCKKTSKTSVKEYTEFLKTL